MKDIPEINKSLSRFFDSALDLSDEKEEAAIIAELRSIDKRYDQEEKIAEGGMKAIYKCHDKVTDRIVAKGVIKVHQDHLQLEKFIDEARISSQLQHPNIMPIYDIGLNVENQPFFTMKLIEGDNLQDILDLLDKGDSATLAFYNQDRLLDIFLKVTDAVEYAHSQDIVHLDIKPANIQIGKFGEVLLCDWGLARELKNGDVPKETKKDREPAHGGINLTLDGLIKGSPGFMAPEQIDDKIGLRSQLTDVYSLGALLYSILTFKTPVKSDTIEETLKSTIDGKVIPASERNPDASVSNSLQAVVQKSMQVKPANRYDSVQQLSNEIRAFRSGFATNAENAGFLQLLKLLIKRNKALSTFILIFVFSFTVLSSYFLVKINKEKKIAITERDRAETTTKELIAEQEKREKLTITAAEYMRASSLHNYSQRHYDRTLFAAENSVQLNPKNLEAWSHLTYIYLGQLKADKASWAANHLTSDKKSWFQAKAKYLKSLTDGDGKVSVKNALTFRKHMADDDPKLRKAVSHHVNFKVTHTYPLEERLEYAKIALEEHAKGPIGFIKIGETYSLDLSMYKKKFRNLDELKNLPISKLNLSNSLINDLTSFADMPLEELIINNTSIRSAKGLKDTPLKRFHFKGTEIKNLAHLPTSIEILELSGHRMNLKAIENFPNLKSLIIPKNVYPSNYLEQLNLDEKVIMEEY